MNPIKSARHASTGWLLVLLLLTSLLPQPLLADTLDTLLDKLQASEKQPLAYNEERGSLLLKTPQKSHGQLLRPAPGVLEKRVLAPEPARYLLSESSVTIHKGIEKGLPKDRQKDAGGTNKEKNVYPIDQLPQLALVYDTLMGLLNGDRSRLQQHYQLKLATPKPGDSQWQLQLTPHYDPATTDQGPYQRILVTGERDSETGELKPVLKRILFEGYLGEYLVMTLEPINEPLK